MAYNHFMADPSFSGYNTAIPFPTADPAQDAYDARVTQPGAELIVDAESRPPHIQGTDLYADPSNNENYLRLPQDPHMLHKQKLGDNFQETEFGFGEGMYPDPNLDYSGSGSRSRFPIADPDRTSQLRNLAAIKRTDVAGRGSAPMNPYVAGNPDRYGAQPPLVRRRGTYRPGKHNYPDPPRMRREW